MATPRHLDNAPIREGLINIQYEPVSFEVIRAFSAQVADRYGSALDIWQAAIEFKLGAQAVTKNSRSPDGCRFDSPKSGPPHVVMAQTTSFTYSRLKPYGNWEELRDAAKSMWDLFASIAKPQRVNRLAVRYVNVMELPLGDGEEFAMYLTAAPQVPPGLPQAVSAFLQRVVMLDPETGNKAIVAQAMEEAAGPGDASGVTVFLDIDAFKARHLDASDPEIWQVLGGLRDYKNKIFFEHLTEKTMEIFA